MQVLKRVALFFIALGLWGCNGRLTDNRIEISDSHYDIVDYDVVNRTIVEENSSDMLNVGVLLPLSGKASEIGQGMQNAMFMALDDLNNTKMLLKFYDTQSTLAGAKSAAQRALSEGASLLLGPLMSEEVQGASEVALAAGVPMVSFTTSPQVLQKGIYSIGLQTGEQIDRAVSYANEKNKTRLALLVPDNASGLNILKSTLMSTQNKNISLVKVGFYKQSTVDFTSIVRELSAQADFDVLLIADNGNRLKSMVSMFAYNDIMYPNVLFMGTSAWDTTNLSKETLLYHGVYPMITKGYSNYFTDKYKDTFGAQPQPIYAFAYDSVLLASVLSGKNKDDVENGILGKNGFIGVNGFFKILPTGSSVHSLDMLEITTEGPKVVEKADNKKIDVTTNDVDVRYIPYEKLPKFYGKNSSEVLSWLYNN